MYGHMDADRYIYIEREREREERFVKPADKAFIINNENTL